MNPEQVRSLTPKHVKLDDQEQDRIPWEMIAGQMADWPEWVSAYARLKYGLQTDQTEIIAEHLAQLVRKTAIREDWPMGKTVRLIHLAIDEALLTGRCRHCHGTGLRTDRDRRVSCDSCGGSGQESYSDFRRAAELGVSGTAWRRTWRERLMVLRDELHQAEIVITTSTKRI